MSVTLADLAALPRPGNGILRTACFDVFWASPLIERLDWPRQVAEQFLFDHGTTPEFIDQYGHLDLNEIRWSLEMRTASELVSASVDHRFVGWVDEAGRDPHWRINLYPPEIAACWAHRGSWIVPPVFVNGLLLERGRDGLHLVEGHTRLSVLRGLMNLGEVAANSTHAVWVGAVWAAQIG